MRTRAEVEAEHEALSRQISQLEGRRRQLAMELNDIKLAEAEAALRFPLGAVLTRHERRQKKTLRVIFRGVRQGRYGVEEYGTNIKKDGSEGAAVRLSEFDDWRLEQPGETKGETA